MVLFEKFMTLNVLDKRETIKAPARGLLLQGSLEQIIEDTLITKQLTLAKLADGQRQDIGSSGAAPINHINVDNLSSLHRSSNAADDSVFNAQK